MQSGGQRSTTCGVLLSGAAMLFNSTTDRLLETSDLDLLHATSVITNNSNELVQSYSQCGADMRSTKYVWLLEQGRF